MAQVVVTGAAGVVNDPRLSCCRNALTGAPEPGADVYVFVVKIVAFVESTHALKGFATEEHEHAGDPVRVKSCLAGVVWVTSSFPPDCFGEKGGESGETAQIVFDFPFGIQDDRRGDGGVGASQRQEEAGEGVAFDRYVGVDHAKERGVS